MLYENKPLKRDYTSSEAMNNTISNIIIGKIIREKLNVPTGIVNEQEKSIILRQTQEYILSHEEEVSDLFDDLLLECIDYLLSGNLLEFDKEVALENISNIKYKEVIQYSDGKISKLPYRKNRK